MVTHGRLVAEGKTDQNRSDGAYRRALMRFLPLARHSPSGNNLKVKSTRDLITGTRKPRLKLGRWHLGNSLVGVRNIGSITPLPTHNFCSSNGSYKAGNGQCDFAYLHEVLKQAAD